MFLDAGYLTPEADYQSDSDPNSDVLNDTGPKKRGSKVGSKRGKYNRKATESAKRRIIDAAKEQRDWRILAEALGVKIPTARSWIRKGTPTMKPTGGVRNIKISEVHEEAIKQWIEENVSITLKQIVEKLQIHYNLDVSTSAVDNHLEGMLFSVKRVHRETETANNAINKQKRKEYVQKIININGEVDSHVVFIDETNFNLYTKREYGRAEVGNRSVSRDPSSKGPNIHVIGAISSDGLEYWKQRRGSYIKEYAAQFTRLLLRALVTKGIDMHTIVLVIDNAPCHSDLERVLQEDEFNTARIVRLGPYSAPLNPIEAVWSIMKAKFKELHGIRKAAMFQGVNRPNNTSLVEYRLQYMEQIIDDSMTAITKQQCERCIRHVQRHYNRVLDLHDLEVGV